MRKKLFHNKNIQKNELILDFMMKQRDKEISNDSDDDVIIKEKENFNDHSCRFKMPSVKKTKIVKRLSRSRSRGSETNQAKQIVPFFERPSPILSARRRYRIFPHSDYNKKTYLRRRQVKCANSTHVDDNFRSKTRKTQQPVVRERPTKEELEKMKRAMVFRPAKHLTTLPSRTFDINSINRNNLSFSKFAKSKEASHNNNARNLCQRNTKIIPLNLFPKHNSGSRSTIIVSSDEERKSNKTRSSRTNLLSKHNRSRGSSVLVFSGEEEKSNKTKFSRVHLLSKHNRSRENTIPVSSDEEGNSNNARSSRVNLLSKHNSRREGTILVSSDEEGKSNKTRSSRVNLLSKHSGRKGGTIPIFSDEAGKSSKTKCFRANLLLKNNIVNRDTTLVSSDKVKKSSKIKLLPANLSSKHNVGSRGTITVSSDEESNSSNPFNVD